MPHPSPIPKRRDGGELLHDGRTSLNRTLSDFWAWSSSDLFSNSLRGVLAEFIVGTALDCIRDTDTRLEWDAHDLVTAHGIRIEVKSTAYLQSWGSAKPSSLRFGIGKTLGWDARTNVFGTEPKRQADVYVFCVFTTEDRSAADPLAVDQWEFYVIATAELDRVLPEQKTVSLSMLSRLDGVHRCGYAGLPAALEAVTPGNR